MIGLCNERISKKQRLIKRLFDLFLALPLFIFLLVPMFFFVLFASVSTRSFGLFSQERIGRYGKVFRILKIRTMLKHYEDKSPISVLNLNRITPFGTFLRKYNIDEWPQVLNVIKGEMSMVGPRPDVSGYVDLLEGEDRIILCVKPGITGPASIVFRNEDDILKYQKNPKHYNDSIIWPKKVELNKQYILNWSLWSDIKYLIKTLK
ncbi:MAG: sugar transferase [Lutimonas sp.]